MKKIILFSVLSELIYLILSFVIAETFGQWSLVGEIIRTDLRLVSILFLGYCYQQYIYNDSLSLNVKAIGNPQFLGALVVFLLFAVAYTNAKNETLVWQILFAISGFTAGIREELFYRGIVQKALQVKYDHKISLLLATLIFTLSHVQFIAEGQFRAVLLIMLAGFIFGSIFIHTGSVLFSGVVHGLYDALLSFNLVPSRLSNGAALPILMLIVLLFLFIISKKLTVSQRDAKADDGDQDRFSLP